MQKKTVRYWIGTGGCVIVVALLISWTLRDGNSSKEAKAKNVAALALGLLVSVYLYAYTVIPLSILLMVATTIYPTITCEDFAPSRKSSAEQSAIRYGCSPNPPINPGS